jgi:hypothetical protein
MEDTATIGYLCKSTSVWPSNGLADTPKLYSEINRLEPRPVQSLIVKSSRKIKLARLGGDSNPVFLSPARALPKAGTPSDLKRFACSHCTTLDHSTIETYWKARIMGINC